MGGRFFLASIVCGTTLPRWFHYLDFALTHLGRRVSASFVRWTSCLHLTSTRWLLFRLVHLFGLSFGTPSLFAEVIWRGSPFFAGLYPLGLILLLRGHLFCLLAHHGAPQPSPLPDFLPLDGLLSVTSPLLPPSIGCSTGAPSCVTPFFIPHAANPA